MRTEFLFSYGTLQLEAVQMTLFGRPLTGTPDALPEYQTTLLHSDDPATIALIGATSHPIAKHTGRSADSVSGTLFTLTPAELARADEYETPPYERKAVLLLSGVRAWAYVDGR